MDNKPPRKFPSWFEPVCIVFFCGTALFEWHNGEIFWASLFAVAAFIFSVTAFIKKV